MRRQHGHVNDSGNVPYSENLVFWAPLIEGDLRDYVSGVNLTTYEDIGLEWDNNKNMYLFNPSTKSHEQHWVVNFEESITTEYTILCLCEPTTYSSYNYPSYVVIGGYTDTTSYRPSIVCHSNDAYRSYKLWRFIRFRLTSTNFTQGGVYNNSVYKWENISNPSNNVYPSYWTNIMKSRFAINPCRETQYYNSDYKIYVKDLRVYNKYLSDSEILQAAYEVTPNTPPSTPTGVTSEMASNGIVVSWNTSISATSYSVYRSSTESGTYTLLNTTNTNTYTDQSPLSGYNYYKIVASNNYGNSNMSSATSVNYVIPSIPTNLTGAKSGSTIVLNWSSVSLASSYKIYRCATADGTYEFYGNSSTNTYIDSSPLATDNYYKVSAVNVVGESEMSSYVYVNNYVLPDVPTNLTGAKSGSTIVLNWSSASLATSYKVYRCATADGTYEFYGNSSTNSYTDSSPLATDNYYKVSAVNSSGESEMSSYVYVDNSATPDVPFSENLVFYAPLTQDDLTDHISGNSPTTMSNCSKSWDSSKEMWKLTSNPGRRGYYVSPLRYQNLNTPQVSPSSKMTLVIDVAGINAGNNYCAMLITPEWGTIAKRYYHFYLAETRFGGIDTGIHRYVGVWDSGSVTWYKDGVRKGSQSWGSTSVYTGAGCVAVCMANDTSKYEIYAKNVRIYNRAFTASEVAQL